MCNKSKNSIINEFLNPAQVTTHVFSVSLIRKHTHTQNFFPTSNQSKLLKFAEDLIVS